MRVSNEEYPSRLRDLPDPPAALYAEGALDVLALPTVTIVGSRDATPYGVRITRMLARGFANAGACVVSGLAFGIDVAAHRSALEVNGRCCAVLGVGIDVCYPKANAAVQRAVAQTGLVLSEYEPGKPARVWQFPARNRLMAALSAATIVIEASAQSGSLLTARVALDLGRTVGVVPGSVDSPTSVGTNDLLRFREVVPITNTADALALLSLKPQAAPQLAGDERVVWDALVTPAPSVDALTARTKLATVQCILAVSTLELAGAISYGFDGTIRRV